MFIEITHVDVYHTDKSLLQDGLSIFTLDLRWNCQVLLCDETVYLSHIINISLLDYTITATRTQQNVKTSENSVKDIRRISLPQMCPRTVSLTLLAILMVWWYIFYFLVSFMKVDGLCLHYLLTLLWWTDGLKPFVVRCFFTVLLWKERKIFWVWSFSIF